MIRDSFINGLSSSYIRQRLLESAELIVEQAHDKARTLDLAQKNSEAYSQNTQATAAAASTSEIIEPYSPESQSSIAALRKGTKQATRKKSCYFCGGPMHASRSLCPARDATCHNCSKTGHFSKVCQSKKDASLSVIFSPTLCAITAACPPNLRHASVPVIVNGITMDALIDSCGSDSFISENAFKRLNVKMNRSDKQVSMALTSMESTAIGSCQLTLLVNNREYQNIKVDILQNLCSDIILGHDFQKQHSKVTFQFEGSQPELIIKPLAKSNVTALDKCNPMSQPKPKPTKPSQPAKSPKMTAKPESAAPPEPAPPSEPASHSNALPAKFADVTPPSLFKSLPKDIKPIATKSRSFNKDDRDFIKTEIQSLLKAGMIQRSDSAWRAQVLVAKDEFNRRRKRLCVDYSQTINLYTNVDAYPLPQIDEMVNRLSKYKFFSTYDLKSAYHQIRLQESQRKYTAFECLGDLYEFVVMPFGVTNGVPCFQRSMDDLVNEEGLKDTFPYLDNVTIGGVDEADLKRNYLGFQEMIKRRNITLNNAKTVQNALSIDILGYRISQNSIKPDPEQLRPLLEFPPPSNAVSFKRGLGMFAYYAKWIARFSDKIRPLAESETFPLTKAAIESFNALKNELGNEVLAPINEDISFVVECDASDVAISASLNQNGRPVAFVSKTLSKIEKWYPAVEKEALAIIESVRKWNHLLSRQPFTLITDQRSVSYMFDNRK